MKNILCCFVVICLFNLQRIHAQSPASKIWDVDLGGTSQDECYHLLNTSDGGYLMIGYSLSGTGGDKSQNSRGNYDYWIVKINAAGVKQWDKRFGGAGDDFIYKAIETDDDGYLLTGYSLSTSGGDVTSISNGGFDFWVVKINASGMKMWDKLYGGNSMDALTCVTKSTDGGFLLAGYSFSDIGGDKSQSHLGNGDYWILKIDAAGNKLWDKRYGGSGEDYLTSVSIFTDGSYLLCGESTSGISGDKTSANFGSYDWWIIKADASGNMLWQKSYGGVNGERLSQSYIRNDNSFYLMGSSSSGITGTKTSPLYGSMDFWLLHADAVGNSIWDKSYGGSDFDWCYEALTDTTDGFLLGGSSLSVPGGNKTAANLGLEDYWIVKTDMDGNIQWDKTFGTSQADYMQGLVKNNAQGYLLAGFTSSGINGDKSQATKGIGDYWAVNISTTRAYPDTDVDGYGDPSVFVIVTGTLPPGYVYDNTDCNDANVNIYPGAPELCNSIDDNCNGITDDNAATATITPAGMINICTGSTITLQANTGTGYTYQWKTSAGSIPGATAATYTTGTSGIYTVEVTIPGGCSANSSTTTVNVQPFPKAKIKNFDSTTDLCFDSSIQLIAKGGAFYSYQWVKDGVDIPGATVQVYYATLPGSYRVKVTNISGCMKTSPAFIITKSCRLSYAGNATDVIIYPNPASSSLHVHIDAADEINGDVQVTIINLLGEIVYQSMEKASGNIFENKITFGNQIPGGLYTVVINCSNKQYVKQFVLQK